MKLEDRLRSELEHQSRHVAVDGAGPRSVATAGRARTRRARITGGAAVAALLVAAGGLLVANRESDRVTTVATDTSATTTDSLDLPAPEAETLSPQGAGNARSTSDAGTGARDVAEAVAPAEAVVQASSLPTDSPAVGPNEVGSLTDLIAFKDGFVALSGGGTDQAALWFSTDGQAWGPVDDPRPATNASIDYVVAYNGTVHVAGSRPVGRVSSPWITRSDDLKSWESLDVATPADNGSELVDTYTRLSSMASGQTGLIVTGATTFELVLESLLDPETIANAAWSLGDSTGDVTKLIVYNEAGDQIDHIDLVEAGVPLTVLDAWANGESTPFLAVATDGRSLKTIDVSDDGPPVLANSNASDIGFAGRGFSGQLSAHVVWESVDGMSWAPTVIAAVGNERTDTIGSIGGRLVVVTATGPLLTVQRGDNGKWTEARLDPLFGDGADDYQLVDLAFGKTGAVGVVEVATGSEEPELWVVRTDDATSWSAELVSDFVGDDVATIDAVTISAASVAVAYRTTTGNYQVAVIAR